MDISAFLAVLAACLGVYVALLAWRYRKAPGLRDQGWFAAVALTASAFTALNVVTTSTTASHEIIVWCAKAQLFLGALHAVSWMRYASAFLGQELPQERRVLALAVLAGAVVLLPGVGFTGAVSTRSIGFLGLVYRDAEPGPAGLASLGVTLAVFLAMALRFVVAWWRGVRFAGSHVLALGLLLLMSLSDGLTLAGAWRGVYLLDYGFLVPVATVAYALSGRVVEESRSLARLREMLERTVDARTAELTVSREALLRAEKLVALGQFSAGVSHEVSNPAAVVAANLHYLEEALQAGPPPEDAMECLVESREAVERITRLTRQLLDASRYAAAPEGPSGRFPLIGVVRGALQAAAPRLAGHRVEVEVSPRLEVLGQPHLMAQVLERLLDNAVRSVPAGRQGRLAVRAERSLGRARLIVEDDGEGMSPATLARAFDPFFSTREVGQGAGLGLAVARGLVQSMRGDLRLESVPGRGTRAIVELTLAELPALTPASGSPRPSA